MWQPETSIVIPTRSRPTQLAKCLEAAVALDYPASSFEVIVVDDGSDEDLTSVVGKFHSKLNITLVQQSQRGPAAARNAGAQCASGAVIAFTDDDCVPTPSWLRLLAETTAQDPACLVGGRIENSLKANHFSEASQNLIDYLYAYYSSKHSEMRFFASNNMACLADTFRSFGGFCEEFTSAAAEDRDFCSRWTLAGNKLIYCPDAVVFHAHELNAKAFWRQHFRYGRGAYKFHKLRTEARRGRLTVEPFGFYANMLLNPFSHKMNDPAVISYLLAVSQIANAAGFFAELGKTALKLESRTPASTANHSVTCWRSQAPSERNLVLSDST